MYVSPSDFIWHTYAVFWIKNYFFGSVSGSESHFFLWVLDPDLDPDPTWSATSSGSSSGSVPKNSLFQNGNDFKDFFLGIFKHPFQ
jgi:hypothetical protein